LRTGVRQYHPAGHDFVAEARRAEGQPIPTKGVRNRLLACGEDSVLFERWEDHGDQLLAVGLRW